MITKLGKLLNMKPIEKVKAQKTIVKIESGDFNENDIDSLFMALRAYSYDNTIFRELADFVAHNDKRNKGITTSSLESIYLSFKFFNDYCKSSTCSLDIGNPFPIYVKKHMKYQIDKCDETYLKEEFNVTKQSLKSKIDNIFSEDKTNKVVSMKNPSMPGNIFDAINYILSFIEILPVFEQDQVISELLKVIKVNKLNVDPIKLTKYSDKIIVCTMLLLHKTIFEFSDHTKGYCEISCDETRVPYIPITLNENKDPLQIKESFGNLKVMGNVDLNVNGKNKILCYEVMTTTVSADDWCDDNMLILEKPTEHTSQSLYKKMVFDAHLCFNDNEKIGIIVE